MNLSPLAVMVSPLVLASVVACSASSTDPAPASAPASADAATEAAPACGAGPDDGIFFLEPEGEIPDCLKDSRGPVSAVERVRLYTDGDASVTEAQFGDEFCRASVEDGCHLTSGCGIYFNYDLTGFPGTIALDVVFSDERHFEGTIAADVPQKGCKAIVRVRGRSIGI